MAEINCLFSSIFVIFKTLLIISYEIVKMTISQEMINKKISFSYKEWKKKKVKVFLVFRKTQAQKFWLPCVFGANYYKVTKRCFSPLP